MMSSTILVKAFLQRSNWSVFLATSSYWVCSIAHRHILQNPPSSKRLCLLKNLVEAEKIVQVSHYKDNVVARWRCGNMKKASI